MSPKMKEALADITAAGHEGAYRKNWHGATVAALLRSGAVETVPGDDTVVRARIEEPMAHVQIRDAAQDALDAEQERTGVHAACGLKITDHCDRCDECPRTSGPCWCMATDDDGPVVIVKGSTAPGFTIPFGPEITRATVEPLSPYAASIVFHLVRAENYGPMDAEAMVRRFPDMVDKGDRLGSFVSYVAWEVMVADYKADQEAPKIIDTAGVDRITASDVANLPTPGETVAVLHGRERRWDRRRKVTSGRRVSARQGR